MNPLEAYAILRVALAVALYGFFGALLWLWWRSERASQPAPRPSAPATLTVVDAGRTGLAPERVFAVGDVCTIGRAATADVVIADDGASLEHCVIHRREGRWWIEDLGSKNGTWLNQSLVERPGPLRAGDMIAIAGVTMRFTEADADRAA